jgi:hypothetical protein
MKRKEHTWMPRPIATCLKYVSASGLGRGVGATGIEALLMSHGGGLGKSGDFIASFIFVSISW